jgi:cytochrome c-type biogenesis protein CcsB
MTGARKGLVFALGLALGLGVAALALAMLHGSRAADPRMGAFAAALDLSPLDRAAVYHRGRLKSFQSYAEEVIAQIAGREGIQIPAPTPDDPHATVRAPTDFAYLDLMIRPERYDGLAIIYLKNKPMRATLAQRLVAAGELDEAGADRFIDHGLLPVSTILGPASSEAMAAWSRDLVRTAKFVDQIENAIALTRWETLRDILRIIPPPNADPQTPWLSVHDLWAGGDAGPRSPGEALAASMDPGVRTAMQVAWARFVEAWRAEDAIAANAALAEFTARAAGIAPDLYPHTARLGMEAWYFEARSLVWGWIIYLLAVVALLMAVAFRWEGARWVGLGLFAAALAVQTLSLGMRWYVSGRWPNSNMFEAVTTSVWFGAVLAVILEVLARRTPVRNLFAHRRRRGIHGGDDERRSTPTRLDASINNMMPILHDLWLYIHTNVIIASYALIAMAAVTAVLYLVRRAIVGGLRTTPGSAAPACCSSRATAPATGDQRRTTLGEVLDGATLVLMELSFVLLWAGIVMGAIWADHSWGRPWGWDPKEVFALNTFLMFVVLIHVRLKVRDKGLWTAILAIDRRGVMLFNWIVINFVISGLHSYA